MKKKDKPYTPCTGTDRKFRSDHRLLQRLSGRNAGQPYGVEHRPENSQTACIGVCRRVAQRTVRALQR